MASRLQTQISEVISRFILQTCSTMFGKDVLKSGKPVRKAHIPDHAVVSSITLQQKDTDIKFCFSFEHDLLWTIAAGIYTSEQMEDPKIFEDIACEFVNIVCSHVKAHLNKEGYDVVMDFPYIPKEDQQSEKNDPHTVHMNFYYNREPMERSFARLEQMPGVSVDFLTEEKAPPKKPPPMPWEMDDKQAG